MTRESLTDKILQEIREKYGQKYVGPGIDVPPPPRLSTGLAALDEILGGGWPMGRISELWGPEHAGKSTLALVSAAAAQRRFSVTPEFPVMWFDQENTFEPTWATKLGVDLARVKHHGPLSAEDGGDLILQYIRDRVPLVVVDSVIEMLPEKSLLKGSGEAEYSPVARFLASWLPKIVVLQGRSPTVLLLINQVRDRIGFFFGETVRSPGGHVLAHLNTVKLKIVRKGFLVGKAKEKVGYEAAVRIVKSKVGGEQREMRFYVYFDRGVVESRTDAQPSPEGLVMAPDEE